MPNPQHIDDLIQHVSSNLGLLYISPGDTEGNVCYANEPSLRPEFRQSFTLQHIKNYLRALAHHPALLQRYAAHLKTSDTGVVYPLSAKVFWELADNAK
ncbi:hypothetical protein [Mucilaginibacter boryungensis]|uniref:Uncharacterized protein n=1 Tax=Mucilaginibacter boryungensis TaxID=768480 RepID=A0ABR9XJN6_9SPHI|nr:hypothetical protein [Mucilaginibacter boryungensis]MBE9667402.1 hypothetical protein [Mucilaginibacter boryungensis]